MHNTGEMFCVINQSGSVYEDQTASATKQSSLYQSMEVSVNRTKSIVVESDAMKLMDDADSVYTGNDQVQSRKQSRDTRKATHSR